MDYCDAALFIRYMKGGWMKNKQPPSIDPSEATVTNYTDNVKIYEFRN